MPDYSVLIAIFLLRFMMGLRLVFPGWMLIMRGKTTVKEYVGEIEGPLAPLFKKLGKIRAIEYLNKWGLFLSGLALAFGMGVRLASYVGILLMVMYWLTKWPWREGVIDERIVSIAVFILLIIFQAGFFLGFDYLIFQMPQIGKFIADYQWLRWIL